MFTSFFYIFSSLFFFFFFFFFNDTSTTEIYTLSLHDALPTFAGQRSARSALVNFPSCRAEATSTARTPHRSEEHTLNSSHVAISYAVFCLKKKKQKQHKPVIIKKNNESNSYES